MVEQSTIAATPGPALGLDLAGQESDGRAQFLQVRISPQLRAALPVESLTEVLAVPFGQIVPIPHMPDWVMGAYNWRGDILWVADLGHLLGMTPWHQLRQTSGRHAVAVLHGDKANRKSRGSFAQILGVAVAQVDEIATYDATEIQSPPDGTVSAGLAPFLRGYWVAPEEEMVAVLDARSLLARAAQSSG
ncbi:chemotaxis protein CheW [Synechococcus sp. PCC 7336]|uniref:chemotaxis protein CheW n=1 Tax=Synechococcus sp. PCC 7336 TaxID=195250 RepID=UPI000349430D|nr:chemotaxis protein CheW [Synechococcus sp. PCC 7336]